MNDLALQPVPTWVLGLLAAGVWLTAAVWLFIVARLFARRPLVAYEPRVPVPWRGLDLLLIVACYLVLQVAGGWAVMKVVPEEKLEPPAIYNPENTEASHMVARVLAEGDWRLLLLCGFAAALVAPVVEGVSVSSSLSGLARGGTVAMAGPVANAPPPAARGGRADCHNVVYLCHAPLQGGQSHSPTRVLHRLPVGQRGGQLGHRGVGDCLAPLALRGHGRRPGLGCAKILARCRP